MAGYYGNAAATAEAFDEEGFFRTGDAARWVDPARPEAGLEFAGRVSEEFKLASGTWVRATTLRTELFDALQPYVRELVIAAPDRPWLGALVWLDPVACTGDWPGGSFAKPVIGRNSTSNGAGRARASAACCRSRRRLRRRTAR